MKRKTVKLVKIQFSPNLMAFIFSKLSTGWRGVFASDDRVEQRSDSSLVHRVGRCRTIKMCLLKKNVIYLLCGASVRPDLSLSLLVIINHIFTHYKASKHHQRFSFLTFAVSDVFPLSVSTKATDGWVNARKVICSLISCTVFMFVLHFFLFLFRRQTAGFLFPVDFFLF